MPGRGDPPVELQPEGLLPHPVWGDERLDREIDPDLPLLRDRLALHLRHGLGQEAEVGIEPHRGDVPVLFGAQEVPGPPDLQVSHGDGDP